MLGNSVMPVRRGFVILLTLPCASALHAQEETILIAPRFTPGESHYCEWSRNVVSRLTGGGGGGERESAKRFRETWGVIQKVDECAPDGSTKLTLTLDRIAHEFESGALSQAFDSDLTSTGKTEHPMAVVFRPLIGQSMTLVLNKDGSVKEFRGLSGPLERIAAELAGKPEGASIQDKIARLRHSFSDEMGRVVWGESRFSMYPFCEVKVGQEWKRTWSQPYPTGDLSVEIVCRLARIEKQDTRRLAVIEYEAVLHQPKPAASSSEQSKVFAANLEGRFKGTTMYDPQIGLYVSDQEIGEIELDVTPESSGAESGKTQRYHQRIESRTSILTLPQRNAQKEKAERAEQRRGK